MADSICWSNTDSFEDSDVVIVGVPDESQSYSLRKGTSEAPDRIRQVSLTRDTYERNGTKTLGLPFEDIKKRVYDYGNVPRHAIKDVFEKITNLSKIPLAIGGDHSITKNILETISNKYGKISLIYFDAHPDFVSSSRNYYGSVFFDVLDFIDTDTSVQVGIRTPEKEELDNLEKYNVTSITPVEMETRGLSSISKMILDKIGQNVYVSFDMDCIDPAFAPGVSVPVPCGLGSLHAMYLLKSICRHGVIGLDMMEVCPSYDIKDRTSHLASRFIGEILSSVNTKKE